MSAAAARATFAAQLARLSTAATGAEGNGWAAVAVPLPASATGNLDMALKVNCSLSIDIFARSGPASSD